MFLSCRCKKTKHGAPLNNIINVTTYFYAYIVYLFSFLVNICMFPAVKDRLSHFKMVCWINLDSQPLQDGENPFKTS